MKRKIKFIGLIFIMLFSCCFLASCRAEDQVQHNIMQDIGNFKTYRKVTIINLRSSEILMEFTGYLTTKIDSEGDVNIMIMIGPGKYQLHYVRLADEICYLSEQLDYTPTNPYEYKISIYAPIPKIENPS